MVSKLVEDPVPYRGQTRQRQIRNNRRFCRGNRNLRLASHHLWSLFLSVGSASLYKIHAYRRVTSLSRVRSRFRARVTGAHQPLNAGTARPFTVKGGPRCRNGP